MWQRDEEWRYYYEFSVTADAVMLMDIIPRFLVSHSLWCNDLLVVVPVDRRTAVVSSMVSEHRGYTKKTTVGSPLRHNYES